jgi:DNA-nicking Smr family endonuclease
MDFGDILDQWDHWTGEPRGKRGPKAKLPREDAGLGAGNRENRPLQRVDPLTAWLRVHGTDDKDAETAGAAGLPHRGERRRRLLAKKPDAELDLHGLTRDEAWLSLEGFFRAGQERGFEKLLIIHGKGNHSEGEAVLKRAVRDFIERCPFAGESGQGSAAEGGSGTTWVLLKGKREA